MYKIMIFHQLHLHQKFIALKIKFVIQRVNTFKAGRTSKLLVPEVEKNSNIRTQHIVIYTYNFACAPMFAFFYLYNQKQISGLHMMRGPEEEIHTYAHRKNVIFSNCTSIMRCAMFHRGRLSNGGTYLRRRSHE